MNPWIAASVGLLVCLIPCGIAAFRGNSIERLVGLEMAGIVEVMLLVTLAQAMKQASFYDLALALALLAFGGGLVFARFLERWL